MLSCGGLWGTGLCKTVVGINVKLQRIHSTECITNDNQTIFRSVLVSLFQFDSVPMHLKLTHPSLIQDSDEEAAKPCSHPGEADKDCCGLRHHSDTGPIQLNYMVKIEVACLKNFASPILQCLAHLTNMVCFGSYHWNGSIYT